MVKSGDWINHGSTGGDSTVCTEAVANRLGGGAGQLKDIEFWMHASAYPYPELQQIDPMQEYHCIHEFFFFPWNRKARDTNGVTDWAQWGWACVAAMADAGLKDLGIHTEMLNAGLIKMIESCQVTNKYKNLDKGKSVWTFVIPFDVQWYYDTIHHNQSIAVYDINYTNNFDILRRIDNMIAIDNCVAVALLGQQCSGFYGKRPISSTGGYFQFVVFCAQSKGGRGVVAMTSRSKHGRTSRIVPFLPEGASVDVPAQFATYVCTEYGIVNLRGLSGYERASALISIAHPDDHEWLERAARESGLARGRDSPSPCFPRKAAPAGIPATRNGATTRLPWVAKSGDSIGSPARKTENVIYRRYKLWL